MGLETIHEMAGRGRALGLHAAARRLRIPERTLRYQASRGRIPGAFKQGKLWKFWVFALEDAQRCGAGDSPARLPLSPNSSQGYLKSSGQRIPLSAVAGQPLETALPRRRGV